MYDIRFMQALFPAAEAEAAAMGEREPGTEHLILASLDFEEGSARRVFERTGADPDQFRVAVIAQHEEARRSVGIDEDRERIDDRLPGPPDRPAAAYRSSPSAREVFPDVVKLVKRDRSRLSGAYLLLVASQMEHGNVARAFTRMGVDRDGLAAAAQAEINELNA